MQDRQDTSSCKDALQTLEKLRRRGLSDEKRASYINLVEACLLGQEVRIQELEEELRRHPRKANDKR